MRKKLHSVTAFDVILAILMVLICFACVYPMWYILANSLAAPEIANRGPVAWWPRALSLDAYKVVFQNEYILSGFKITILRTVVATFTHVFFTSMVAYGMSRKDLIGKKFYLKIAMITMFFNGGLIPNFILMIKLKLYNTFWVYILPKGTLTHAFHPDMILKIEGNELLVDRPDDEHLHKSLHGLTRTLIHNMVEGVEKGFTKELEVNGVGYRAEKKGSQLVMRLGFSHEVFVDEIPGITIEVPAPNKIIIHGIDKQTVGQFAAEVRGKRPPEPYKGKGIKYTTEVIRRKVGKTGGKK